MIGRMDPSHGREHAVVNRHEAARLQGIVALPPRPVGVVLFAHGSGSGRNSPRNRSVAAALNADHLATVLLDLLEEREVAHRRSAFDLPLLTARLAAARPCC